MTAIERIKRRAQEVTSDRATDDPPAYDWRDSLIRELHRDAPAATSAELAAAEAWIRKVCGC